MSHKKDKKRVAAGQIFRDGKVSKLTSCPVPDCPRYVVTGNSAHGLCPYHEELLSFLLFVLPRITLTQAETPSGLVLPGQPGFGIERHGQFKP